VKQDGSLWATGRNDHGQLGDGSWNHKKSFVKVIATATSGSAPVMAVAAGDQHTMVVKQDGSLWATGWNKYGQLGDGSIESNKNSFVKVISSGVKAVAAGSYHTMVVKQDGSLWATGDNVYGRLGDGSTALKKSFVKVIASGVKAVAAGSAHTMVVKQDGSLWATGGNKYGQLGDGSRTDKNNFAEVIPTTIKDSLQVAVIAASAHISRHTMVVKQDSSLWATGFNDFGQLGDGSNAWSITNKNSFVQVISSGVKAVATGFAHTMVVKQDGSLWAAGRNDFGQLGDGSNKRKFNFVQVQVIARCPNWCARNVTKWIEKCTWAGKCDGCSECLGSTTRTATTASTRCQKWCASNAKEWTKKCTWSGRCDGCSECLASTTSTVPAGSTSAQKPAG